MRSGGEEEDEEWCGEKLRSGGEEEHEWEASWCSEGR